MNRRYCVLVGRAVVARDGRCPECRRPWAKHRPVPDGVCGTWVRCAAHCAALHAHGTLCALAPGHDGEHRADGDAS